MESKSPYLKHEALLTELFQRLLPNPSETASALKSIKKTLESTSSDSQFRNHELSWVLREAFRIGSRYRPQESKANLAKLREVFSLEENPQAENRLSDLTPLLRLLPFDQRFLIITTEILDVPISAVSSALSIPEESLKLSWKQAMASLETWIWN